MNNIRDWVGLDEIADPLHRNPEAIAALKQILMGLFDQYDMSSRIDFRSMALRAHSPKDVCYQACDTGVPNEMILGAYALLFL